MLIKNMDKLQSYDFKKIIKELDDLKNIIFECTQETVKIIIMHCNGYINIDKIHDLFTASFLVAISIITSHDLLISPRLIDLFHGCHKKLVKEMFYDILKRTDYKGCHQTINIKKFYDTEYMFKPRKTPRKTPHKTPRK